MPVRWAGKGRIGSGGRLLSAAGEVLDGLMHREFATGSGIPAVPLVTVR
jgi:hypothetical protein